MSQVEVTDAAADLAGLIARARDGEEVVLIEEGHAVARLIAVSGPAAERDPRVLGRPEGVSRDPDSVDAPYPAPRRLGVAEGKFKVPDDFDAPLPDDLLDLFYNGPLFPPDPKTAGTTPRGHEDGRDETRDGS